MKETWKAQPVLRESAFVEESDDETKEKGQKAEEDADAGQRGRVEDARCPHGDWKKTQYCQDCVREEVNVL